MIKKTKRKKVIHCNLSEVYTSVAFCPGVVVIIHAPKSCSHILYNAWLNSKRKMLLKYKGIIPNVEDNLFMTCMTDKEAIFGGEKLLERSVETVLKEKNPKCIIVVSGCAAAVIGDDVQSVCNKLEEKYNVPIIFIPGSGFMSDQTRDGLLLSTKYLYKKFVDVGDKEKDDKLALILGLNKFQLLEWEFAELERIYKYFGYEKLLIAPCGMSIEELYRINKVAFIAFYAPTMEKFREYNKFASELSQVLNVPQAGKRMPLSIEATYEYINSMGILLGKEKQAEEALDKERRILSECIEKHKDNFIGKGCAIALGHPLKFTNLKEVFYILRSIGFTINKVLLLNDLTDAEIREYQDCITSMEPELPVIVENDFDNNKDNDDVYITSIFNDKLKRQFVFRRKRIGIGGVKVFLEKLSAMILNNRSLGHE